MTLKEAVELWDSILTEHPGSDLAYYKVLDAARAVVAGPSDEAIEAAGKAIWKQGMKNYDDGTGIKYTWGGIGEWPQSVFKKKAKKALLAADKVRFGI